MALHEKLRKNLGQKNCEMTPDHIDTITNLYMDFVESDISKIYPNEYFGYHKITVERPLRLSAKFTPEAIASLRFDKSIAEEMEWAYAHFGDELYQLSESGLNGLKDGRMKDPGKSLKSPNPNNLKADIISKIEAYLSKNEIKLKPADKTKLLSTEHWKNQLELMEAAQKIADKLGSKQFDDYNSFVPLLSQTIKELKLDIDAKGLKNITEAISWKNEDAERVIKKKEKDGTIIYEADSELRDTENVPLDQDIHEYFQREVLQHVPDAWIDESKTVKGYEISFTRYFYNYVPPRSIEEITAEIFALEQETEGILNEIVND
jgi:type I restriction enzyme M protein